MGLGQRRRLHGIAWLILHLRQTLVMVELFGDDGLPSLIDVDMAHCLFKLLVQLRLMRPEGLGLGWTGRTLIGGLGAGDQQHYDWCQLPAE